MKGQKCSMPCALNRQMFCTFGIHVSNTPHVINYLFCNYVEYSTDLDNVTKLIYQQARHCCDGTENTLSPSILALELLYIKAPTKYLGARDQKFRN